LDTLNALIRRRGDLIAASVSFTLLWLAACSSPNGEHIYLASARGAANKIGCQNIVEAPLSTLPPLVETSVTCEYEGSEVTVYWFRDQADLRKYRKGTEPGQQVVYRDHFAVLCTSSPTPCAKWSKSE
jgi:hypothetical protein